MDLSYQTMRFGPKKRKISIIHLRKPVSKGLGGMVKASFFPQTIALVVDPRPIDDLDYSFMCLSRDANNESVSIWMEEDAFYGIKRGDVKARTALFHELGHYYHHHLKGSIDEMVAYDEARSASVQAGRVIQQELEADLFAVDYLGREYDVNGLKALKARLYDCIRLGVYDEETGRSAIKELELRISAITV